MDEFENLLGAAPLPASAVPPASELVPAGAGGERAMGAFEGADRLNGVHALWSSPMQSADLDILPEKGTIDTRARDIQRNDAFVQGGASLRKDNIVGSHYLLNCRPATRVLFGKEDDTWEEEFQEEVETKWELYADSPDCWIDAARTNNFTSLVRMAVGIHLMAGEVLGAVEWITDDGAPYSTAIQMVDLDRLSDPADRVLPWMSLPNQRAGIKYNDRGAPQSYFIRKSHPNDFGPVAFSTYNDWTEVALRKPWGRLQIIHLFEQLRPDQSRGVTEMASALKAMKLTHTWRDITVQHAAAQSVIAAAITSELPMNDIATRLNGDSAEAVSAAVTAYAEGFLGSVANYVGKGKGMTLDGVKIPRLFPGEKLELKSPAAGPLGTEFEQSLLRYIAASLGVSYEQLSRDYTNTNYSSARAAMAETWKFMSAQKKLIADRFATICFRLWLEEAINAGHIEAVKRSGMPRLYNLPLPGERYGRLNTNFDALSRCEWVGASRGQIDESKETDAAIARINAGLSTAEDELARLGKDWRKVFRQIKREQEMRKLLGLVLPGLESKAEIAAARPAAANTADERPSDSNRNAA